MAGRSKKVLEYNPVRLPDGKKKHQLFATLLMERHTVYVHIGHRHTSHLLHQFGITVRSYPP